MSPLSHIHVLYHRALAYWNRLIGFDPSESDVLLIPDITRYFFSEAIDDRVKFLADGAAAQEESFRDEVTREYRNRVEQAIRQELKAYSNRWQRFSEVEKNLSNIKVPTQFTDDLFATRTAVMEFMRWRMSYYVHTTHIGPLHFWPQVLQFIINWPSIVALLMAFRLYKP